MQVTFIPADTALRLLKQPVANASGNSNPLTLRVPAPGAKSGRLLI
jgi:hypothetical protein